MSKEQLRSILQDDPETLSGGEVLSQAIKNVPSSALQFGKDIITPILNPITTAKSVGSLASSVINIMRPGEQGNEQLARSVGNYFANRYGGLENIKKSFAEDPVGVFSDVSTLFTGGAMLAAKAPSLSSKLSTAAKFTDPLSVTKPLVETVGKVTKPIVGMTTGAGAEAIGQAYQAGKAGGDAQRRFLENIRGQVPAEEVVTEAAKTLKEMSKDKTRKFKSGKTQLQLENKKIDFSEVNRDLNEFAVKNSFEGMTTLSTKGQKMQQKIYKIIKEFEEQPRLHNAKGLDMLKKRIDAEYPRGLKPGDEAVVVTEIRNKIKERILKEVPEYADVMKSYEDAITLEKQLASELSLGKNVKASTTLQKLQSTMRNNVNTNYGARLDALNKLNPDLLPSLAGQSLQSLTPRGIAGLVGTGQLTGAGVLGAANLLGETQSLTAPLAFLPTLALQSPRIMGETTNLIGRLNRLPNVRPTTQTLRQVGILTDEEAQAREELDKNILRSIMQ